MEKENAWERDLVVIDALDLKGGSPAPLTEEQLKEVAAWLLPTDYAGDDSELTKHKTAHLSGTGTWVDEAEAYSQWLRSPTEGILWICGELDTAGFSFGCPY